jgi:hypothetical protein
VGSLRLNLTAGGTPRPEARSQLSLENSLGAQSALVNLETHAFTTIWHGHHLHYSERFAEEKQPTCCCHKANTFISDAGAVSHDFWQIVRGLPI